MGKYTSHASQNEPSSQREVHPIWRGIGLFLMVLTPFMAYMATLVLLEQNEINGWMTIPKEMLSPMVEPMLFVKIGLTVVLSVIIFGILQFISFIFYSMFAPPRYGPLDAPPINKNPRHYKR